ncbi:diketogulonate reductase-like aldo/keto reductase [Salana multivorans]|uniref:Diketogulonate reductase-like aldo/keto reductase n=1 Tax=Salana multivorans TaxID=120377 RepID=A0A3N2DAP0_9MICO|nr:aldo/keto reductase [Salana multivorans]MBN8883352.1 aldo/keto reductase [Salana multivorans]OJX96968.1 MAG: oxidoreductase [Micrococcales bacterium 73-15]ROR96813.1 diketogulonate reductase-like aldo/keto reductase [Salana multivorans]
MLPDTPGSALLNDGTALQLIGLGLYKVEPSDTERVVLDALDVGYRLIDGAAFYGNEREVGDAVRESGLRGELRVTSKAWGDPVMSYDETLREFDATERDLGFSPDVYLIHWPRASRNEYVNVWRALIRLREEGRVRTIGVCSFGETELTRLIDETGVVPALNQVESHPWLPQHGLREFHDAHGILTQAWSPLGRGRLMDDPVLLRIAAEHGVSVPQVVLRWHLQLGGAAVPKSTHRERLAQNIDLEGFALTGEDMAAIAGLETGRRTGTNPADRQ